MERTMVALSDTLVASSHYILEWMRGRRWTLPENVIFQRYPLPQIQKTPANDESNEKINNLVFSGNLNIEGGLSFFCNLVDSLSGSNEKLLITFIGEIDEEIQGISSKDYIKIRSSKWDFPIAILPVKNMEESLSVLSHTSPENALVVVAPEHANTLASLQFLASQTYRVLVADVGGLADLLSPESRQAAAMPLNDERQWTTRVLQCMNDKNFCPKSSPVASNEAIRAWWKFFTANEDLTLPTNWGHSSSPLVSVVITHYNRPEFLLQALASIKAQDYLNFEVIVVDDASDSEQAIQMLQKLEDQFAQQQQNWRIVRMPENSYLGKARNFGVQHALGKYVLFMDDDNFAKPNEISTFVTAAEATNADILTSAQDYFYGDDLPPSVNGGGSSQRVKRRIPLGGDVATGFFWNCYGDANSFVQRASFLRMGGFTEDYNVGYEDYEFFAKAVLEGYTLEVVPESLFWYRGTFNSMSLSTPLYQNRMRYLRPYMDNLQPALRNMLLFVQAMHYDAEDPYMGNVQNLECSGYTNCSECLNMGCGWCPATNSCMPGSVNHSASFSCNRSKDGWVFGKASECRECARNSGCDDCAKAAGCGWCDVDDRCYAGASYAFYKSSPCNSTSKSNKDDFVTDKGNCSGGSSKTISIIVGASVAGFLLLTAIVATVIFFVYQYTKRPGSGYMVLNS
eukprot:TRINITY_DN7528_c0_g1_i1.p1 TRINITY_DN7528_c0_g1~~TRINITY_DN7528_c0_g1_i1.p1  ORF type:complete len:751 (+),score=97.18 TRINITY_DN7528_c0_g1_i1:206-2254(+)